MIILFALGIFVLFATLFFFKQQSNQHDLQTLKILQDTLQQGMQETRQTVKIALNEYIQTIDNRLNEINQQVEKKLSAGFEKTTETFTDVIKRLALIDAAQKRITELSNNVMSLQDILNDKRSRGAFGEVQLSSLIRNVIPESHFSFQHSLSNGKRADCVLFLPEPTGNVAIDAKFPLENFRVMTDTTSSDLAKKQAEQQFRLVIKKHIQDIADKYILPGETADGAVMFIPAEAVFAEIHGHYPDLVEYAQRAKVWMVSPTTLMAVLTTARAVIKDAATKEQVHIIQKLLQTLSVDFDRFQKRMDNLARHISQANSDITEVHTSAKKITQRFNQIEQVELDDVKTAPILKPNAELLD